MIEASIIWYDSKITPCSFYYRDIARLSITPRPLLSVASTLFLTITNKPLHGLYEEDILFASASQSGVELELSE